MSVFNSFPFATMVWLPVVVEGFTHAAKVNAVAPLKTCLQPLMVLMYDSHDEGTYSFAPPEKSRARPTLPATGNVCVQSARKLQITTVKRVAHSHSIATAGRKLWKKLM